MSEKRPCERLCPGCGQNKHHSRFAGRKRKSPNGTVWEFDRLCRDCQQIERNEKKNADRALAIIKHRASAAAQKAGFSTEFMMVNMNYYELVEQLKAKMDPFGHCKSCGHEFVNERDIQLDHILPPRHKQDTARLHARNIQLLCASCNNTKGAKDYAVWLDEQDAARLTNESANKPRVPYPDSFDEWRRQHDSVKQPGPKADASSNGGKLLLGFAD